MINIYKPKHNSKYLALSQTLESKGQTVNISIFCKDCAHSCFEFLFSLSKPQARDNRCLISKPLQLLIWHAMACAVMTFTEALSEAFTHEKLKWREFVLFKSNLFSETFYPAINCCAAKDQHLCLQVFFLITSQ